MEAESPTFRLFKKRQQINISITGDSGVGKSSLVNVFCKNSNAVPDPTIGIDYVFKEYKDLVLNIFDVSGKYEYQLVRQEFYKGINVALVIFDLANKASYDNIEFWLNELKQSCEPDKIAICGNKVDLKELRLVTEKEAAIWACLQEAQYFEISALHGTGVKDMFGSLLESFL